MKKQIFTKSIFLIGPPNCGKSTLFNWLTGFKSRVLNYPGSTVSLSKGTLLKKYNYFAEVIDSPGTYSLDPQSEDEKITIQALSKNKKSQRIVLVLDISKLEVQLPLFFKLKKKGYSIIVALTMSDILPENYQPQANILSQALKIPVIKIKGLTGEGVLDLVDAIKTYQVNPQDFPLKIKKDLSLLEHCKKIVNQSLKKNPKKIQGFKKERKKIFLSQKWDRLFLHPKFGFFIFMGIMFTLFCSIFWLATPFMDLIDEFFSWLIKGTNQALSFTPYIADLVSHGILAGFGSVLVFVPQIFILFIGISLLEDTGYLARAVCLMDGPLSKIGLSGRSFIPFLSGYACAIPSLLLAKNIDSQRERKMLFFSIPFMSCSARLPVYALLLSFIFYKQAPWKAALSFTAIYIASFLLGLISVTLLNFFFKKEKNETFLLDLPIYRKPSLLKILNRAYKQSKHYIVKAGPPIFILSVLIWGLTHYPASPHLPEEQRVSESLAAQIGLLLEPFFKLMGMDGRVGFALIAAFVAREVFVSALLLIFMITKGGEDTLMNSLLQTMTTITHQDGSLMFTTASVISLIVFFMFSLQCISTSAVVYKESGSLKFAVIQFLSLNIIAYILAVLCFQTLNLF
ncbi:MAG: ferrous iron transporter B [Bdellovibrionales bacterium]|nr:ferrous iron transporter B [Bdellovibrionales bacterium]